MMQVCEVTTREALGELQPHWEEILRASGDPSPFLSFDWITRWWDYFGRGRELFILAAKDAQGFSALAPFMLSAYRRRGFAFRALELIGAPFRGRCLATRLNLIVGRAAEESLAAIAGHLAKTSRRWDLCSLRALPAESPHIRRLGESAAPRVRFFPANTHKVLFIPTRGLEWEQYLAARNRHFRNWLRGTQSRLPKNGLAPIRQITSQAELEAALPDLAQVCAGSWKAADQVGLFGGDEAITQFLGAFVRRCWEKGELLLTTLSASDKVMAYQLSFCHGGSLWFYDTAYAQEHNQASPGANLVADMIREGFLARAERIDLGPGRHPYKTRWTEETEARTHWMGFHGGLRSRVLQLGFLSAARWRRLRASGKP